MAKLHPPFPLTGKWAGLSVYFLPGVGWVGRQPWGPSAKEIRTKDCYDLTRRHNGEHGGCSTASKYLRRLFRPLEPVRDYALSGPVTGWLKAFLSLDEESELGHRHVLLSKAPRLLEGINLSKRHPFDSVVRGGITCTLNRETVSALVHLPPLLPGVSFIPPGKQPYFKVVASLGAAPDIFWTPEGYACARAYDQCFPAVAESGWMPTASGTEAITLELQLPYLLPDDSFALVLTLGIVMGTAGRRGDLEAVKYAGSAKVVAAE